MGCDEREVLTLVHRALREPWRQVCSMSVIIDDLIMLPSLATFGLDTLGKVSPKKWQETTATPCQDAELPLHHNAIALK